MRRKNSRIVRLVSKYNIDITFNIIDSQPFLWNFIGHGYDWRIWIHMPVHVYIMCAVLGSHVHLCGKHEQVVADVRFSNVDKFSNVYKSINDRS